MDGIATLTMNTSMMHMNWPRSSTASIGQLRAPAGPGTAETRRNVACVVMSRRRTGCRQGDTSAFLDPPLEEAAFRGAAGERQRRQVGVACLSGAAEPAQQLGTGGMPVLGTRQP